MMFENAALPSQEYYILNYIQIEKSYFFLERSKLCQTRCLINKEEQSEAYLNLRWGYISQQQKNLQKLRL